MSVDLQDKIANLRLKIEAQEREVTQLEQECQSIQADLADFEARYNQHIKPLINQIEAAKEALKKLRELHFMQQMGNQIKIESLWRGNSQAKQGYIPPHERDFAIPEPPDLPIEDHTPEDIKKVYRKLARQYHPDLAADEADRARRTKLMSMINTAYQDGDLETLSALDEHQQQQPSRQKNTPVDTQISLNLVLYRNLEQKFQDLAIRIRDLKEWRYELQNGPMMQLKLEDSLSKARGEDLIAGLTEDMQAEYWRYQRELEELRAQVD